MAFGAGEPVFYPSAFLLPVSSTPSSRRFLRTGSDDEFSGRSAYEVLGVPETSSFSEIKASFRRLAKETHPDVSPSSDPAAASHRFLQILAAYEILSDSEKRALYDSCLFSQRKILQKHADVGSSAIYAYRYNSCVTMAKQTEVVEWLKWYRLAVDDIVSSRRVAAGSGYFGEVENELYSAIRAAYYGPVIESMDHLPDCFEAEERSCDETSEVLHLVSGRDLLGIVYVAEKAHEISRGRVLKLISAASEGSPPSVLGTNIKVSSGSPRGRGIQGSDVRRSNTDVTNVYRDVEVHIAGRVMATATRIPPKNLCGMASISDSEDYIHVFLSTSEGKAYMRDETSNVSVSSTSVGSRVPLGTIRGLGTSPEEGSCFVYDNNGAKTHMIMKHRTLMVKHMHWYQIEDEIPACECRCSRARLPPSRFWLFEPRSCMHDIGGWYIETFGRDKKGKTVPSQRRWDDAMEHHEKRLHPAMYLVALAYRTLDLEDAKRRKRPVRDIIGRSVSNIFRWCKKLM